MNPPSLRREARILHLGRRMQALLRRWTDALLVKLGLSSAAENGWDLWVALLLVLLVGVLFDFVCRLTLARGLRRLVEHTRVKWDDDLFSMPVLNHSCHVLSAILLSVMLPVVFEEDSHVRTLLDRLMESYVVIAVCRLLCALIRAGFRIAVRRPAWQNKPIKGLRQTAQGIVVLISAVLIISILVGRSPTFLLTGIGASAAVLMLVFKDSILGFVSGIQLSVNDMLQVGDWIEMTKYGANGVVIEVTLTTVKIRNYDNTVVTVPPYLLVSDSFQNWQAMKRSGGRRVMRSVSIDISSVRFCTPERLERFRRIGLVREYIETAERQYAAYNAAHGLSPTDPESGAGADGLRLTNLEIFRNYLIGYLRSAVPIREDMTLMVRQLQPSDTGVPLQLYFFTDTVVWQEYERIQSEVFSHVMAVVGEFDLRIFQRPAGSDVEELRKAPALQQEHQHDLNQDDPQEHADGVDRGV